MTRAVVVDVCDVGVLSDQACARVRSLLAQTLREHKGTFSGAL